MVSIPKIITLKVIMSHLLLLQFKKHKDSFFGGMRTQLHFK